MKDGVARVKYHQSDKNHHVGQPVERRVKKSPKPRHPSRQPCDLTVKHVKDVRNNQNNAGPKEKTQAEEQPTSNIYCNTDERQVVRVNPAVSKPTHHRINDALRTASDTCSKHPSKILLLTILNRHYT